ncbi:MAG: phosphate-starvation-inducible PsiE family protein [Halorubrum sp.]
MMEIRDATDPSATAMQWLVLGAAYFLLVLFVIGLFDMMLSLYDLFVTGRFTDPVAVVELLDIVLLLLIIVEVHRTLIAYAREEPVLRIVVSAAIIAVSREIISFRADEFETGDEALSAALAFAVLILVLIVGYFLLDRVDITA